MFERYTERARRLIFFSRYEASQFGSPYIETEHLLLGFLREDKSLTSWLFKDSTAVESIREQIAAHTTVREKVSTSVDLPLSNESKRVLEYASEESGQLTNTYIGTEHLLLGLLREENCYAAAILHERGLTLDVVREEIARGQYKIRPGQTAAGGVVVITSVPLGAEIEIDGAFFGNTPAELPLAVGERSIKLTKKGYQPWERQFLVIAGGKQTISPDLELLLP